MFCGLALLTALFDLRRIGWRARSVSIYLLLLVAAWILGFIDALVHAGDAWASMPGGLILSAIVTALVFAATWLGVFDSRRGEAT